ncbi:MAG: NapC/NirT family cytochrome c [Neptuniibacter sp.]
MTSISKPLRLVIAVMVVILLGFITFLLWAGVDKALGMTSGQNFCGSCHSMAPMTQSYLEDNHAVVAECTDCHLPHTGFVKHYLYKAQHGIRDVVKEYVTGTEDIDWIAKLSRSQEFVFVSGCVRCHEAVQSESELSEIHEPFAVQGELHCIACHRVGHQNLHQLLQNTVP